MELYQKKINFLGDSITFGFGTTSQEACFVNRIASACGLAAARNYGECGTRYAAQQTPSEDPAIDRDFCSRVDEMDADADIVVVFGGTNDFGHGDAPLGHFEDRTPYTFYGACHTLYRRLIERFPDALIVVLTPLHRDNEDNRRGDGFKTIPIAPLCDYVSIIRQTAAYYGLPVLDLFSASGFQPKVPVIRERYFPDGLHPNDLAHAKIAEKLTNFLKMQ